MVGSFELSSGKELNAMIVPISHVQITHRIQCSTCRTVESKSTASYCSVRTTGSNCPRISTQWPSNNIMSSKITDNQTVGKGVVEDSRWDIQLIVWLYHCCNYQRRVFSREFVGYSSVYYGNSFPEYRASPCSHLSINCKCHRFLADLLE